ncbi:MAG: GTPase HflX, partial [Myxococcales bacterium]|nr:GTPase HflX [Myxococcales bacterium]
ALLTAARPSPDAPCELERLCDTAGVKVVNHVVVTRARRSAATFIGPGRLAEIAAHIQAPPRTASDDDSLDADAAERAPALAPRVDLVVVDAHLSPRQLAHLEDGLGVPVIDRTAVILHIFEQRAQTRESRLEVELARLRYDMPRLRKSTEDDDRRGGGGRGERGHTNVQLEKMRIRDRISQLGRELEALQRQGDTRRMERAEVWTVALVGYTNAGKSTLMRALTGADVLAEDRLFATLGTTVRKLHPAVSPQVLVSDTVGFIRELPHELVASFHSTLDQARTAHLCLLVVDASDPEWAAQLQCVLQTLGDTAPVYRSLVQSDAADEGASADWRDDDDWGDDEEAMDENGDDPFRSAFTPPRTPVWTPSTLLNGDVVNAHIDEQQHLLVFNKADRLNAATMAKLQALYPRALFVSALQTESVQTLRSWILAHRDKTLAQDEFFVPWRMGALMSTIRASAHIVSESHDADGTHIVVRALPADLHRWRAELPASTMMH